MEYSVGSHFSLFIAASHFAFRSGSVGNRYNFVPGFPCLFMHLNAQQATTMLPTKMAAYKNFEIFSY